MFYVEDEVLSNSPLSEISAKNARSSALKGHFWKVFLLKLIKFQSSFEGSKITWTNNDNNNNRPIQKGLICVLNMNSGWGQIGGSGNTKLSE